jgi:hypothetical protein
MLNHLIVSTIDIFDSVLELLIYIECNYLSKCDNIKKLIELDNKIFVHVNVWMCVCVCLYICYKVMWKLL